jgi:hypothetical protein
MQFAADPEHGMSVDTSYHNPDYHALELDAYLEMNSGLAR